ncbi:protein FAR1-RELATED SEQUENCE 5-like [Coffea arabica]|uniref:Protein FAR1-RELATED SEQUENCE 5-like n=1 Tax=Coffea arabica TaxID=13443 RepID=A0A6P6X475_COFAR|nr:uncharacterized protein LOC113739237 [Coffea arabica]
MDYSKLVEDGTPELGMEFNNEDDVHKFYNKYAFKMDFSVCKDYLNKNKNGVTTYRRYSCCKEGVKRKYESDVMPKRTRALMKTSCGTKMIIVLHRRTMKYCVHDLVLEHNHSHELTRKEVDGMGNVGYTRDDFKQYLCTRRKRRLKYGETDTGAQPLQPWVKDNIDGPMTRSRFKKVKEALRALIIHHTSKEQAKFEELMDHEVTLLTCTFEVQE